MAKFYIVKLSQSERKQLRQIIRNGKHAAKRRLKARVLLKSDAEWTDEKIALALDISTRTIENMRRDFVQEGLEAFLEGGYKNRNYPRKLDGKAEAYLIATVCSEPPSGKANWTLHMLADRLVKLQHVDSISHETVRQTLKKTS